MKIFKMAWMILVIAGMSPAAFGQRITVTSPAGGERWALGDRVAITWTAIKVPGNVRVNLIAGDGTVAGTILNSVRATPGRHPWPVGELASGTAAAGEGYRVRVRAIDSGISAESAPFAITPQPALHLILPNGGGRYTLGDAQMITWQCAGLPESTRIKLELYRDGRSRANRTGVIAGDLPIGPVAPPGAGLLWWHSGSLEGGGTAPAGSNCYFVKISTLDGRVHDFSDTPFTLDAALAAPAASIEVATPRSALTLTHIFDINWVARGVSGGVTISLIKESGGVYTLASGVDPGRAFGRFNWRIGQLVDPAAAFPAVAGERFCFQVGAGGGLGGGVLSRSGWFAIERPGLRVVTSVGGSRMHRGEQVYISWDAPDIQGFIRIEAHFRRLAGGATRKYADIIDSMGNIGHYYDWTIWPRPGFGEAEVNAPPTGSGCRWFVRVVSLRCPTIYADSPEFIIE